MKRITHRDYYLPPSLDHRTGDIWSMMPTFGLLKNAQCSGIVITPACDLANSKVETLTYLPIISIAELFASRIFYPVIRGTILNLTNNISGYSINDFLKKNYLPQEKDISFLIEEFKDVKKAQPKIEAAIQRVIMGLELTKDIITPGMVKSDKEKVIRFFGEKEYQRLCVGIIRNSFASDLHFFPKDGQDPDWSSIPLHSTVLFRYPITAPIEVFESANDPNCIDWTGKMAEIEKVFAIAAHFKAAKPLKTSRLSEYFLSDMLTRFGSLFLRIGSPDFDDDAINKISSEL